MADPMLGTSSGADGEEGSGTVIGVAVLLVILSLLLGGLSVAGAVVASHRARAAADLAALAGASILVRGGAPEASCLEAASVAQANAAALRRCEVDGMDMIVEVDVPPPPLLGDVVGRALGPAHARARAGPPSSQGARRT